MATQVLSSALHELLDVDVTPQRVATGFTFTEGPVWMPDGSLHFSDIPENKRYRWHPEHGVSVVRDPTNEGNGATLDNHGHTILCEHASSRVVRLRTDGAEEVVASHYRGKELNSPNDVIVSSDNSVVFTDPDYGRAVGVRGGRERELDFRGVFRVPPGGGEPELLVSGFDKPNGLCLSPDESLLYVNDSPRAHIRVFDVGSGFALSNDRVFADGIGDGDLVKGGVDGMKADERGNIYVTGPRGIWVYDAAGIQLGVIEVPETTGNLNWGGPDWTTLYIAASSSIYSLAMRIAGNKLPYMR